METHSEIGKKRALNILSLMLCLNATTYAFASIRISCYLSLSFVFPFFSFNVWKDLPDKNYYSHLEILKYDQVLKNKTWELKSEWEKQETNCYNRIKAAKVNKKKLMKHIEETNIFITIYLKKRVNISINIKPAKLIVDPCSSVQCNFLLQNDPLAVKINSLDGTSESEWNYNYVGRHFFLNLVMG